MNINLNRFIIFYPKSGETLREQLEGKVLAGVEVRDHILETVKRLRADEIIKVFPEDWHRFVDRTRDSFYFLTDVTPDPQPTYQHGIPTSIPAFRVAGIKCRSHDDGFFGIRNAFAWAFSIHDTVRTDRDILDVVVGTGSHYNNWHPWHGILIER